MCQSVWLVTVLLKVSVGMTITNFWKLFYYGFKRHHYEKSICIREFWKQLALDCFYNPFSTDTGTPEKNTPPLDEVDDGETVSTCREVSFPSSNSCSTQFRTIYEITINSDSLPASTLVGSTIGYQHTAEKREICRQGGIKGILQATVMRV